MTGFLVSLSMNSSWSEIIVSLLFLYRWQDFRNHCWEEENGHIPDSLVISVITLSRITRIGNNIRDMIVIPYDLPIAWLGISGMLFLLKVQSFLDLQAKQSMARSYQGQSKSSNPKNSRMHSSGDRHLFFLSLSNFMQWKAKQEDQRNKEKKRVKIKIPKSISLMKENETKESREVMERNPSKRNWLQSDQRERKRKKEGERWLERHTKYSRLSWHPSLVLVQKE